MRLVPNLKQVALRLPDDLAEWLEQLAEEEERSVAFVVREIIAAERERRKAAGMHLTSVA
jgi:predicted DNA-binding protein